MLDHREKKYLQPVALALLLFGIYTTERFKFVFHGVSLRFSLLALMLYFCWRSWLHLPGKRSITKRFRELFPDLQSFVPFFSLGLISAVGAETPATAGLVWAYNIIVIAVSLRLAHDTPWKQVRLPWLVALTTHASILCWDQLAIGRQIPIAWTLGGLYPTYDTFRAKGFYVAPQFYSVAIVLSGSLWLYLELLTARALKAGILAALTLILTSSVLTLSRTGVIMLIFSLMLVMFATAARRVSTKICATITGVIIASISVAALVIGLITPSQSSLLSELFGIQQTWARVCPVVLEQIPGVETCPISKVEAPENNPQLTSEGRRVAEWEQLAQDLKARPFFGYGYAGVLEHMTHPQFLEEIRQKRVQYRYESVWATVGTYYGFLGLLSLIFALLCIAKGLKWHWSLAAPLSFWLVGAHSSQVFARLDIWVPLFIYISTLRRFQNSVPGAQVRDV